MPTSQEASSPASPPTPPRAHGPLRRPVSRAGEHDAWPAAVLIPLAFAAVVFFPITRNYFLEDDFLHLYQLHNESLFNFITMPHGGHVYLARNTLWYLASLVFGDDPAPYFWMVLAIHLLNVALLFRLIRRLTQSPRLACAGAALWGVAPANEGSLGWFCVYGHALATTFLLVLLGLLADVADGRHPTRATLAWFVACLLGASTSFGIGMGMVLVFPLAVFLMLPPSRDRTRLVIAAAAVTVLLLPLYEVIKRLHPSLIAAGLPASLDAYWFNAVRMFVHFGIVGINSVLRGPAFIWELYPNDFAYLIAALVLLALAAVFWIGDATTRRRLAALAVLAASGYAIIGAGRARRFDYGPAVLQVPRYHYAVPALFVLAVCIALATVDRRVRLRLPAAARDLLLAAALALMVALRLWRGVPIDHHDHARELTGSALAAMRQQIDAVPRGGDVYIKNEEFRPIGPVLRRAPSLFPGLAAVFVIYFPDNVVDGRHVYFVEDRLMIHFRGNQGRRTAGLFVSSDSVPGAARAPDTHGRATPRNDAPDEGRTVETGVPPVAREARRRRLRRRYGRDARRHFATG